MLPDRRRLRRLADRPKDITSNAVRAEDVRQNQIKARPVASSAVATSKLHDGAVTETTLADGIQGRQGPPARRAIREPAGAARAIPDSR